MENTLEERTSGYSKRNHTVIELGEAGCDAVNGKLSLGLLKPNARVVGPELGELSGKSSGRGGSSRVLLTTVNFHQNTLKENKKCEHTK